MACSDRRRGSSISGAACDTAARPPPPTPRRRAGRFRIRAPVDRRAGRQDLVPGHRGRACRRTSRAGTIRDSERARPARRSALAGSASATTRTSTSRARRSGTYRDALRQNRAGARTGDSRARAPARPISGGGRRPSAPQLPGPARRRAGGLPSELLERRPDVDRRRAARRRRVQPHPRGEGRAPAGDRAHRPASARSRASCSCCRIATTRSGTSARNLLAADLHAAARSRRRSRSGPRNRSRRSRRTPTSGCGRSARSRHALAGEIAAREREQILAQTLSDNQRALEIVRTQFKVGSTDLRFVTQRQLSLNAAQSGADSRAGRTARSSASTCTWRSAAASSPRRAAQTGVSSCVTGAVRGYAVGVPEDQDLPRRARPSGNRRRPGWPRRRCRPPSATGAGRRAAPASRRAACCRYGSPVTARRRRVNCPPPVPRAIDRQPRRGGRRCSSRGLCSETTGSWRRRDAPG